MAVNDLAHDIYKITGKKPKIIEGLPTDHDKHIIIGCLDDINFNNFIKELGLDMTEVQGKWEGYAIKTFGLNNQSMLICGSDKRGTMWGIYEFCDTYLGVDPLYFWTDNEHEKRNSIYLDNVDFIDYPKTYQYRGWFINDEVLLTGWKNGSGKRMIDYPFYHKVIHEDVIDIIIETALRLKQNLLIPASFLDIDNPDEEMLVKKVTDRGLIISQHHIETLGVSLFTWDNYWKKKNKKYKPSYILHPDKFKEIWTYYVQKWSKYEDVIWQLGLRGKGDKPVWESDSNFPEDMKTRGKIISDAIKTQHEIIQSVLRTSQFKSTVTLWMEGAKLHNEGFIKFPNNTTIVLSDFGPTQMWQDDFYRAKRLKAYEYGSYYHLAFWSCGPHLVQGCMPQKIYYNFLQAVRKGDTSYSIANVGNIREHVMQLSYLSNITWDFNNADANTFLKDWCLKQFNKDLSHLYDSYYHAFFELENERIPKQMILLEGMAWKIGRLLLDLIGGKEYTKMVSMNQRLTVFDTKEEFISFYYENLGKSIDDFIEVYKKANNLLNDIPDDRKMFYTSHFIVQIKIIIGLYKWIYNLLKAMIHKDKQFMKEAIKALEQIIEDEKQAMTGKWENWYFGDTKLDINLLINQTKQRSNLL